MMTNLFSIFDPASSNSTSMNWLSTLTWILLLPFSFWLMPNRIILTLSMLKMYIFSEFKPLINKYPQALLVPVSLLLLIMFNNLPGLLPFVFTPSSHMSITLSLALPLWTGIMIHGWVFNTSNLLIHLIPSGTPTILMPFMVIIETISNIIRPLTLAIRLAANMIAGHLLIALLMAASPITPVSLGSILFSAQAALMSLELAVALIQAYVFSVLITLYSAETIS